MSDFNNLYKLVIAGDTGVDKTSLFFRYTKDVIEESQFGIDFGHKSIMVKGKTILAEIWDSAGQERFRGITEPFYSGAVGALVVYDVTNRTSFNNVGQWLADVRQYGTEGVQVSLVGNKLDLDGNRTVTKAEGAQLAALSNLLFIETSAINSIQVDDAFYNTISRVFEYKQAEKRDLAAC